MNHKRRDKYERFGAEKKRLVENFFSLSSVDFANYILPLIAFPYLVRILGPEKYGLIAFAQAFIQYFVILTDYGFNFSATRSISMHRADHRKISMIFNSVIWAKGIFTAASFIMLIVIIFLSSKFRADALLYFFTFGIVIGNTLFPIWFFQGMERMKFIAAVNLLAKLIFVVAIFIFIKRQEDYIYVPLISSCGFITAGIISLWQVHRRFGIRFGYPDFAEVKNEMRDGWYLFVATITASIYTTGVPLLLGLMTNYKIVGFYSAGEKIVRALENLQLRLTQTLYPYIGKLVAQSVSSAVIFIRKLATIVGLGTLLFSVCIIVFSRQIVHLILGDSFLATTSVLSILAPLLFAKGLGHIFLIQTMMNFGDDRAVFWIVLCAAVISVVAAFILIPILLEGGAAIAALLPEVIVLVLSGIYVTKKYHVFSIYGLSR
ncbi:MAG: flippase [Candidatus Omnitrophota bacterium]